MTRLGLRSIATVLACSVVAGWAWQATAQAPAAQAPAAQVPAAPPADGAHLGVSSCAGSTCHGAVERLKGSHVVQNEYIIWSRKDKHAQAYTVLLEDRSLRIAHNLGLADARTAPLCLDCHADNVPDNMRGPQFQISDGV